MSRAKWMVSFALLSVFTLGAGVGTLTARFWARRAVRHIFIRPADQLEEEALFRSLDRRVGLDAMQFQTARQLVAKDRRAVAGIRRRSIEQVLLIRERQQAELMPHLTSAQQARLQELGREYRLRQEGLLQDLAKLEAQP